MKYLNYCIVSFIFAFLFCSCGMGEWHFTSYSQPIEGTSKILYKYDASGGRDTMVSGYLLLDSTEVFEVDLSKNLALSYLEEIPNKKYIFAVDFEEPDYENWDNNEKKIFTPINNSTIFENGIEIKSNIYQNKGFIARNQGFETYDFESFKETRDSVFFYYLDDVKSMEPKHLDILKFKKKNIVIRQTKGFEITRIEVCDLQLAEKTKEIISNVKYELTPKNKMKSTSFSNHGILNKTTKYSIYK